MKKNVLLCSFVVCLNILFAWPTDQPFASFWFPCELLSWTPASDPDADYNRSNVVLADRFINDAFQVNTHARPNEGSISALYINGTTNNNPAQGYLALDGPNFNYWQYIDTFVFWGGSAGEGLILAPTPDIVDAGHRNGVPVLGTVFFPPTAYGGQIQWVNDFLQSNGTTYPVADKLIEVAEYYGFDGYFINQETAGGNGQTAAAMRDFMLYYQQNSSLELMWYDAMTESGYINWQEQLNSNNDWFFQYNDELVSEYMFLDFGWNASDLTTSRTNAHNLGRSEFELYAGIDVQANGYNTYTNWGAVFPENQPHTTSVGFYCPNWCYHASTDISDFYTRANRFWVGENRNPANTSGTSSWKGVAHYIPAYSVINELPFATSFCTGQGYYFNVDGETSNTSEWYNRGMQDVLPTWRWLVESNATPLFAEFDFSDAFFGGNCLQISGDLSADNLVKLYKTSLPVNASTILEITYKTGYIGDSHLNIALATESAPTSWHFFDVPATTTENWNTATIDFGTLAGQDVGCIALQFTAGGGSDYAMKIGQLKLYDGSVSTPQPPDNVFVESKIEETPDLATLRLKWDHSSSDVYYYTVYRQNPDASYSYLWGTSNNACFVPAVTRVAQETSTTIAVQAVAQDFGTSDFSTTVINWDVTQTPDPATNPYPQDQAEFASINITDLFWTAGQNAASHDIYFGTTNPPAFIHNQVSSSFDLDMLEPNTTYYWKVDEVNSMGTTPGDIWSFTTASIPDVNVALESTALASSQYSAAYGQSKAIDGISGLNGVGEWASSGEQNPWIQLSWDEEVTIRIMKIFDRPNLSDNANSGTIVFDDGSSIEVNDIPNDGSSCFVAFPPKTITQLTFYVEGGNGPNVGLSEIEAYELEITNGANPAVMVQTNLNQNYPNPFNPTTTIHFSLSTDNVKTRLEVFNVKGQLVKTLVDEPLARGNHSTVWDGKDASGKAVSSGMYFYRLQNGSFSKTHKMILMK